jgi:putative heme-binding domain-containing protein
MIVCHPLLSRLRRGRNLVLCFAVCLFSVLLWASASEPEQNQQDGTLVLRPGDHICLVGNTLPERMQHDGWLDTYLHSRFPKHDLVIRNLAYSGDELTARIRSASFGSPDQWLRFNQADVVFAFFGYNESFAGEAGLTKFKADLETYLKHLSSTKFNGKQAPRVVLFSPIACENLHDRNLPSGAENNQRIAQFTAAMAEVAKASNVLFIDLYEPTLQLYAKSKSSLTINGVHLTDEGNKQVAKIIDSALFRQAAPARDSQTFERIRQAVLDRNFYWFNRYRTVDGYSIYGGRADLKFVGGQTNREVMDREMDILNIMAINRDKAVWAAANGAKAQPNDSNLPPFIPVKTNKPGPLEGGKHIFLGGDQSLAAMTVAKGLKVNVFASEKDFPILTNPVQMSWDTKGRLWVAIWHTYPHWKPGDPMDDKIVIFEDTDGDGKADKYTVFADGLHCPTGFEFWNGGVLVAQAPYLVFLKDTKGEGRADVRLKVLGGLDSADTHHTANSFVLDPGGGLYFQEGTFHHTQVETPYGPPVRNANAGVYRYEPRTQKFDVYVNFGFANPHGHVFDRWGQDFVVDGTGSNPYHAALFSGRIDYPARHKQPPQLYTPRTRPCPGMEILSSRHFPDSMQGNLLVANVIGFQGILQYKINPKGASFSGTEVEPILSSTDPNFRPSDLRIGPDGALYFIDWHNPIIGHMQHNLRDPSRDRDHGRIYRVTYEGRPLLTPKPIAGEPIDKLLDLLKEPEDRVRYRVRIELGGRDSTAVGAALAKWVAALDSKSEDYEHNLLEALWAHQNHNLVDAELLQWLLTAKDHRARAAAARVLCYWRDRVPGALETFKQLAADSHPLVRLEAVRAASFYREAEAIEVVLVSMDHPTDAYLDFVRSETMRALDPAVKKAIAAGGNLKFTTPAGARYFVKNVPTESLLQLPRTPAVFGELLARAAVRDEVRKEAVTGLAGQSKKTAVLVLLEALKAQDALYASMDESVAFDLSRLLVDRGPKELTASRGDLENFATSAKTATARQLGYVALIAADNAVDKAWALAVTSAATLEDLCLAMPLIRDPSLKAALYPKIEPLVKQLPPELGGAGSAKSVFGRYVRVELPGKRKTLTLAEVEVYSDGRNVARSGKATQQSTAFGGVASRAIDGNKSGSYAADGQSHTAENGNDPWWEVDLGKEYPITSIVIYNRTDDDLGKRLSGYTLKVLDGKRALAYEKKKQAAPAVLATFNVGSDSPERIVRRAAMRAIVTVRGQETAAFKAVAPFVRDPAESDAAIAALQRLPVNLWPKEEARPLLDALMTLIRKVPEAERTLPETLEALQLADSATTLLPPAEAKLARKELSVLGTRMIRLGTVVDQMLFDKERIVVTAGRPVEIIFENTDLMPHNFVVLQPGSLEEVGNLAEATATQPGALEMQYVPKSSKVLFASKLVPPRGTQKISFTAPTKPGVYPYVCTYPGHWRRMYGALYVVQDLDDYLADPTAYLARNPLPIDDNMLKFIRPRTEWKFDDLAPLVAKSLAGRSFGNGKQMFVAGTCVACHKLGGVGIEIGPDLTKLDPKQQSPLEILRDILEPSLRINEKYQSWIVETNEGKLLTGLIVDENKAQLKILENPLAKADPIVVRIDNIASKKKSPTSIMPKGLIDQLTREEILDLVAYIAARGDPQHESFHAIHDHKH